MGRHGRPIENLSSFHETLRKLMETNAVCGVAREPAPNPSPSASSDLYSLAWVRAILTKSDISDWGTEHIARNCGATGNAKMPGSW